MAVIKYVRQCLPFFHRYSTWRESRWYKNIDVRECKKCARRQSRSI